MLKLVLNNLPETVIPPVYDAYEVDTFLDTGLTAPALLLSPRAERLLHRACNELRDYRAEAAIHILEEALLEDAGFFDAQLLLGILHAGAGRLDEAAQRLSRGLSVEERSGELLRRFLPSMRLILRISRFHFFQLYPDYYGGSLLLAAIYGHLGKVREASRVLSHLRDLFGTRDEERVLLAEVYLSNEDYANARAALERKEERHRDELDTTITILKGYCEFMQGQFHEAAITLKSEVVYGREKNPYLVTIARFLYTHALEEDGLPVLALKESAKLNLDYFLNPQLREYIARREEHLKNDVESLDPKAFFAASEFRWFSDKGGSESEYMEVLSDEYSEEDGRDQSWERPGIASIYERLYRLGQHFKSVEGAGTLEKKADFEGGGGEEDGAQTNGARPTLSGFDIQKTYKWCASREGEEGFLRFDFRGTRKRSTVRTGGERRLSLACNWGLIAIFVISLILALRSCS